MTAEEKIEEFEYLTTFHPVPLLRSYELITALLGRMFYTWEIMASNLENIKKEIREKSQE